MLYNIKFINKNIISDFNEFNYSEQISNIMHKNAIPKLEGNNDA